MNFESYSLTAYSLLPWYAIAHSEGGSLLLISPLLFQKEYNSYYVDKLSSINKSKWDVLSFPEENKDFIKGFCKLVKENNKYLVQAASAIAVHNIDYQIWEKDNDLLQIAEKKFNLTLHDFALPHETLPLAFLLRLVDVLQDWDSPLTCDICVKGDRPLKRLNHFFVVDPATAWLQRTLLTSVTNS